MRIYIDRMSDIEIANQDEACIINYTHHKCGRNKIKYRL